MGPITAESIMGYWPGKDLEPRITALFKRIIELKNWEKNCPNLMELNATKYNPQFSKLEWGRIGMTFFTEWFPGIFAGVLLDTYDHQLPAMDLELGPEFVVFLEFQYHPKVSSDISNSIEDMQKRKLFVENPNFRTLTEKIRTASDSKGFDFQTEIKANPWRILVLRKPLIRILQGVKDFDEQVNVVNQAICDGINLLTQDKLISESTWNTDFPRR